MQTRRIHKVLWIPSLGSMKALVMITLVACASAQVVMPYSPALPYRTINMADIYPSSQFHAHGDMGQFSFGHSSLDNTRSEVRLWTGDVLGHYSYVDANGQPAITYYEAGRNGFKVLGSNRLPEAPEYTKEVADARADFAENYEKVSADGPSESFIDYTKEVADARADFAKVHEEASSRTKRNVFLPALFTDMEKGADDDKITAYSRNDPSWAYGFTTKSQYTLKPVTYSGYPFFPFAPAVAEAAPSRTRREAAMPLPYMHPMMPSFPATWYGASLPVTYRTGAIPYFTQPFNNFLPFKTQ